MAAAGWRALAAVSVGGGMSSPLTATVAGGAGSGRARGAAQESDWVQAEPSWRTRAVDGLTLAGVGGSQQRQDRSRATGLS